MDKNQNNFIKKIVSEIKDISQKMNAIILAHNYQPPEIQDIAHMCGDSLELSIKASKTKADIIVFCGVRFMAETAYILSPNKTILLPESSASCPMVDMINPSLLLKYINKMPRMPIITYVNSSAKIKAMSDICCTSSNAVNIVNSLKEKEVIMIPDKNLAKNTEKLTNKKIHFWNGFCPIHNNLTTKKVITAREKYPNATLLVHPECNHKVVNMADACLSTAGMINYVSNSNKKEFIIGTEIGIIHSLTKKNPNKKFYPLSSNTFCQDMKKINLEKILISLKNEKGKIVIEEKIRIKALNAVKRMINISF